MRLSESILRTVIKAMRNANEVARHSIGHLNIVLWTNIFTHELERLLDSSLSVNAGEDLEWRTNARVAVRAAVAAWEAGSISTDAFDKSINDLLRAAARPLGEDEA